MLILNLIFIAVDVPNFFFPRRFLYSLGGGGVRECEDECEDECRQSRHAFVPYFSKKNF